MEGAAPQPVATRPLSIAVDGGAIPAWTAGDGTATLILLHGWSLDHRIWLPQLTDAALVAGRRLIAIDRRGFGAASAPPDLGREPDDLCALLDAFGIDRAIIVGQSQAGRVALQFALDHGDRTAGLVLAGAPAGGFHPRPHPREEIPVELYRTLVAAGRIGEMRRRWAAHPLLAAGPDGHAAPVAAMLDDYDGRDLLGPVPPAGPDIGWLHAIDTPALVVTGDGDTPWRRRAGDALAAALPHGRRAGIGGAGHLCNADTPRTFNRLLDAFARSLAE